MSSYQMGLKNSDGVSEELDNDPLLSTLSQIQSEGVMLGGVLLKSVIAEGGMGTVYKGWHTRLNIPVAVKILKRSCEADVPMFMREARLTVSLDHPNLVRVYDLNVERSSGLHFMVMEYVEGCSAYQLLERQMKYNFRPLTPVSALEIGLAVAKAMGAAHAKDVVHRDIKSDNILIRSYDGAVKLADLGLAGTFHNAPDGKRSRVRRTTMAGTIGFISPEVAEGAEVTPAADVYGLGATLYELLTGTLPHGAPFDDTYYSRQLSEAPIDPREVQSEMSADVAEFLMRCIARKPKDRFCDGNEMAEELKPLLEVLSGRRSGTMRSCEPAPKPVVLCVDDEQDILNLECDMLANENFTPVCVSNPMEALNRLHLIKPDVVVLDLNMPQMNGIELCQRLREVRGFEDLGVIILSGEDEKQIMDHAFHKGITDYLLKPLNLRELVLRLSLLTDLRAMNKQKKRIETQLLHIKRQPSRASFKNARRGDSSMAAM
jgi:serine/threonine protein kinase